MYNNFEENMRYLDRRVEGQPKKPLKGRIIGWGIFLLVLLLLTLLFVVRGSWLRQVRSFTSSHRISIHGYEGSVWHLGPEHQQMVIDLITNTWYLRMPPRDSVRPEQFNFNRVVHDTNDPYLILVRFRATFCERCFDHETYRLDFDYNCGYYHHFQFTFYRNYLFRSTETWGLRNDFSGILQPMSSSFGSLRILGNTNPIEQLRRILEYYAD